MKLKKAKKIAKDSTNCKPSKVKWTTDADKKGLRLNIRSEGIAENLDRIKHTSKLINNMFKTHQSPKITSEIKNQATLIVSAVRKFIDANEQEIIDNLFNEILLNIATGGNEKKWQCLLPKKIVWI